MVKVTVMGFAVGLTSVPLILPEPLLPMVPVTAGLSRTHPKLVPETSLVKDIEVILSPLQMVWEGRDGITLAVGFTNTVEVTGEP